MTEQKIPPQTESAEASQQIQKDSVPAKQKIHDTLRSKRAWFFLSIVLFLLAGGTLVPVGKIPLLRNLVYAMGYTPEETFRLSLFQALFSWNEHQKILRGEIPDPNALDMFGPAEAAQRLAEQEKIGKGVNNSLFNMKAINAARRRQGQGMEQVVSSSGNSVEQDVDHEDNSPDVHLRNDNVVSNTQANSAKTGDVYFGQDTAAIVRDKNDGYDSINTLKKVTAPIAGVSSSSGKDWFFRLVDKATRQDAQLGELEANLESRGLASGLGNVDKVGNSKADRDLYWAWLTGRAARRTPQLVLKKTLASTGFDGAELPKSVFTTSGFSGVGINPESVVADMDSVKKYLELDEKCQNALKATEDDTYKNQIKQMRANINGLHNYVPSTCGDRGTKSASFSNTLRSIENECKRISASYTTIQKACGAVNVKRGACYPVELTADISQFDDWCKDKESACLLAEDPALCLASVGSTSWNTWANEDDMRLKTEQWAREIRAIYYNTDVSYTENGQEVLPLNSAYFPTIDWGESLWVDSGAGN